MKLSNIAILAVRGTDTEFKKGLAKAMDVTEQTMYKYLASNDSNLTKAAPLEMIRIKTGLLDDVLLEREAEPARQAV
jgi:hypothetical protein